jgi:hypothetical protein
MERLPQTLLIAFAFVLSIVSPLSAQQEDSVTSPTHYPTNPRTGLCIPTAKCSLPTYTRLTGYSQQLCPLGAGSIGGVQIMFSRLHMSTPRLPVTILPTAS